MMISHYFYTDCHPALYALFQFNVLLLCAVATAFPKKGFEGGCPDGQYGVLTLDCFEVPTLQKYLDEHKTTLCPLGYIGVEPPNCRELKYLISLSEYKGRINSSHTSSQTRISWIWQCLWGYSSMTSAFLNPLPLSALFPPPPTVDVILEQPLYPIIFLEF